MCIVAGRLCARRDIDNVRLCASRPKAGKLRSDTHSHTFKISTCWTHQWKDVTGVSIGLETRTYNQRTSSSSKTTPNSCVVSVIACTFKRKLYAETSAESEDAHAYQTLAHIDNYESGHREEEKTVEAAVILGALLDSFTAFVFCRLCLLQKKTREDIGFCRATTYWVSRTATVEYNRSSYEDNDLNWMFEYSYSLEWSGEDGAVK